MIKYQIRKNISYENAEAEVKELRALANGEHLNRSISFDRQNLSLANVNEEFTDEKQRFERML